MIVTPQKPEAAEFPPLHTSSVQFCRFHSTTSLFFGISRLPCRRAKMAIFPRRPPMSPDVSPTFPFPPPTSPDVPRRFPDVGLRLKKAKSKKNKKNKRILPESGKTHKKKENSVQFLLLLSFALQLVISGQEPCRITPETSLLHQHTTGLGQMSHKPSSMWSKEDDLPSNTPILAACKGSGLATAAPSLPFVDDHGRFWSFQGTQWLDFVSTWLYLEF